ncbi:c-type cytochrome [Simplicispira lacusdiani]|uniref:c-type cytochrome n=1 Tax=Simplicispira lacusdiani TaxID=2213010 RepID=UPI000E762B48|nr:c-type cytochrome [Simplicispira lacusdiani]
MQKTTTVLAAAALALFLTACGDKKPAEAPAAPAPAPAAPAPAAAPAAEAPAAAPAAPAAPVADSGAGKAAYGKTCAMCHGAGVAGAPKPGDKADWGPRIAQGKDTLYKHAIEGFTGAKGMMPARGGNSTMSDDDVKAAVDYMVGLSS